MNNIIVPCNRSNFKAGRTSNIKYIVLHYTANNGDTAKNNVDYYANNVVKASAHYYVDEFDTVYQSVLEKDTAWAVGATAYNHPYCRNDNSISIEMCSRNPNGKVGASDIGWYFKEETTNNAIKLTKILMQRYNVPVANVIRHYDVTGKICPAPFVNNLKLWTDFKKELTKIENKYSYDDTVNNMILDGITTAENMAYWEKVLDGREPLNKDYVRAVLDRYSEKMKGA